MKKEKTTGKRSKRSRQGNYRFANNTYYGIGSASWENWWSDEDETNAEDDDDETANYNNSYGGYGSSVQQSGNEFVPTPYW